MPLPSNVGKGTVTVALMDGAGNIFTDVPSVVSR